MFWQCLHCGGFHYNRGHVLIPSWVLAVLAGCAGAAIGLLLIAVTCKVSHAADLDLDLLRDRAIYAQESSSGRDCEDGADGEVGCWQVKLATARQVGFTGGTAELRRFNQAWASEILRQCAARHRRNRAPLRAAAQCYNAGLRAPVGKGAPGFAYAQQVAHRYYAALVSGPRELYARAR